MRKREEEKDISTVTCLTGTIEGQVKVVLKKNPCWCSPSFDLSMMFCVSLPQLTKVTLTSLKAEVCARIHSAVGKIQSVQVER